MSRMFVLVILLGLVPVSAFSGGGPVFISAIDGRGTDVDPLFPMDVALAPWGDVYVVDNSNHRVVRFANDGSLIDYWGSYGSGQTEFRNPQGIALDDYGRVYVADTDNHRVMVFDGEGNYLNVWSIDYPRGIAVGSGTYEYVYVTSTLMSSGSEYVFRYSLAGVQQNYWGGTPGSGPSRFDWARDVEIDAWGRLYVADLRNDRVQYFDYTGNYLGEFGFGTGYAFQSPRALGIDTNRNVFIYDENNDSLLKYSSDLVFLSGMSMEDRGTGLDVLGSGSIYACGADWREIRNYGYPPVITAIDDIPDDQGRWVRLEWTASVLEQTSSLTTISGYGIYRRQPDTAKALVHPNLPVDKSGGDRLLAMADGMEDWDVLGYVPARRDAAYSFVAPTLVDSTAAGGIDWSVFVVAAFCDDGVFFDSAPDSGYSVDNIPPPTPAPPTVTENLGDLELEVVWQNSAAPDFDHFAVYRGATSDFTPSSPDDSFAVTTTPDYVDDTVSPGDYWYYRIGTFDDAGLFSGYSPATGAPVVTSAPLPVVTRPQLYQNVPNPFNPLTVIAYDLPTATRVDLKIFDVSGHLIRVLETGTLMGEGRHETPWNGLDDQGIKAASGLYFYQLEAGESRLTRRMVLMK